MKDSEMPKKLDRKVIYESEWICLYKDKVQMPDGKIVDSYHRLHYPKESAAVAIFNENREILLIRSKRYSTSQLEWEVPAGGIEEGESAEEAARREVLEETGCTIRNLRFLCWQNPSNGISDEKVHLFGAKVDVQKCSPDENEVYDKKWFSEEEIITMLKENEIRCGVSMMTLLYALQFYV